MVDVNPPDGRREFLKYTFYKMEREWLRLDAEVKANQKAELAELLHALEDEVTLGCYSLQGIRADADLMTWTIAPRLEAFQEMAKRISSTEMGHYLATTHAYLAATKRSSYLSGHAHERQDGAGEMLVPRGSRYLFVYPLVKKREWYSVPFDRRQGIMRDHFRVGHKFPSVTIHTAYSFGLDDQEFLLAFESDEPMDFLDLVMELRSTESSRFTERETPIFTCIRSTPEQMLDALGT
ncbi:MAG TPA: chlorite dismutase family protein [Thermoplasmata archaeon]|nr:chlorite dismutase family protein [Thermoplasmata archaeon]